MFTGAAPACFCNASSTNYVQLTCTIYYADGTIHPIYATMTWRIGTQVYTTDTPQRSRIDYYVFVSSSTITVDSSDSKNFTCTVTFNAPTDIEYNFIATNAPEFNASCSVEGEFWSVEQTIRIIARTSVYSSRMNIPIRWFSNQFSCVT